MIRSIINRVVGRKKTLDEKVNFTQVNTILRELDSSTEIKVWYNEYDPVNTNIQGARNFIREDFEDDHRSIYFKGKHQVFSGKQNEKHYLDLKKGYVHALIGQTRLLGSPSEKATLTYFIPAQTKELGEE